MRFEWDYISIRVVHFWNFVVSFDVQTILASLLLLVVCGIKVFVFGLCRALITHPPGRWNGHLGRSALCRRDLPGAGEQSCCLKGFPLLSQGTKGCNPNCFGDKRRDRIFFSR